MENIPPSKIALKEAYELAYELLKNIEMGELNLSNIALRASRLARLLNQFDYQKIMEYEAGGYPTTAKGIEAEIFELGRIAGRVYEREDKTSNKIVESLHFASISECEANLKILDTSIKSSINPNVEQETPLLLSRHQSERKVLRDQAFTYSAILANTKSFIHRYVKQVYYELKFSGIADDIFSRMRLTIDEKIGHSIPDTIQKFTAIYDNLASENPEDWSNAVHGCRRLLQSIADVVFPATEDRINENGKTIKLSQENYINRLMTFVEDQKTSERFTEIVGSHLRFLGERLDSVYEATNKGTHDTIVSREEADRYVVFTYLLIGDVLSLKSS